MAKYYMEVKKLSGGMYVPLHRGCNSIVVARRALIRALDSGSPAPSELGTVGTVDEYGIGQTVGAVRKVIARGSKRYVWDEYALHGSGNSLYYLNKDGRLNGKYEKRNVAGYPNVKYPGWDY